MIARHEAGIDGGFRGAKFPGMRDSDSRLLNHQNSQDRLERKCRIRTTPRGR
jgi:hypothetical protein